MGNDDIVSDLLSRIPSITPELSMQIERAIRQDWSGTSCYISKMAITPNEIIQIKTEVRRGSKIDAVAKRFGIGRSKIYRLLKIP